MKSKLLQTMPFITHEFTLRSSSSNGLPDKTIFPKQVHGVRVVSVLDYKHDMSADGLLSNKPGSIGIITADCLPILMVDPVNNIVSAVHAGWKGVLNNIMANALVQIENIGGDVNQLKISIGPSIRSCCYSVFPKRAHLFTNKYGTKSIKQSNKNTYLDLQRITIEQLIQNGVSESNIEDCNICTFCNQDYYSYRRGDRDKRMISYIQIH